MTNVRNVNNMLDTLSIDLDSNEIMHRMSLIAYFAKVKKLAGCALPPCSNIFDYIINLDKLPEITYTLSGDSLSFSICIDDKCCYYSQLAKMKTVKVDNFIGILPYHSGFAAFPCNLTFKDSKFIISGEISIRWQLDNNSLEAVNHINGLLDKAHCEALLWQKYFAVSFGWKVEVDIDDTTFLQVRKEKAGENSDILGEYYSNMVYNSDTPVSLSPKIILYKKACDEFCNILSQKEGKTFAPDDIYFYVLAHELFHALQDFHVLTDYCKKKTKKNYIGELETQAEYFALRAVKTTLKNNELFEALCNSRSNQSNDYSAALAAYGNINEDETDWNFINDFGMWEHEIVKNVY